MLVRSIKALQGVTGLGSRERKDLSCRILIPDSGCPKPVRPQASLELVRADLALHRVQKLRPLVGLELGDELSRPFCLAFRAGQVIDHFVDLVKDLEDVGAFYTFVII